MAVRIDGNNDLINAADGSLTIEGISVNVVGVSTATGGFKVGTAYTVFPNGNVATAGVVTATSGVHISGSGADLTMNSAGTIFTGNGGNASDPIIRNVSDTNTGVFFPASDTLAVTTGGSEAIRIDSGGRLLVNNTSSTSPDGFDSIIQVNADNHEGSITIGRHTANANGPALVFQKSRSGTATPGTGVVSDNDVLGTIRYYASDGTDRNSYAASISCEIDGTPGGNDMPGRLVFLTTADGSASSTERLRITSSGSVGIGTDTPGAVLEVFDTTSNTILNVKSGDAGAVLNLIDNHTRSSIEQNNTDLKIISDTDASHANSTIKFQVDGGTKMLIDSGGDVRVTSRGSSASGAPFYVAVTGKSSITYGGGNDDTACLRIVDNGSTNSYYHGIELRAKRDGDARIYVQDKGSDAVDLVFATDNSGIVEGMRLDSSQRLLIGTDSAVGGLAHHLQVVEPDGGKLCLARNDTTVSNGANLGEIAAYGNDNNGNYQESSKIEFQAGLNHGDNDKPGRLVFSVTADGGSSATERLRITHDGKLDMFTGGASSLRIDPASTNGKAIFTVDADSNFGSSGYDFRIDGTDSNALMMVIRRGTNPFVGIGRDSQQSAERLSVDRAGQVAFFTMSMNANHSNLQMLSAYATSSTNGTQISFLDNTGTQRGRIINDNSTTQYVTSSDYRLKENEVLISDGITRLKTLKPYRFNWKQKPGVTVDGFFAHEVTSAVPEAIAGEKDAVVTQAMVDAGTHDVSKLGDPEYQMIDPAKLVPLLTAALQEEISKREALEARVAALEGS